MSFRRRTAVESLESRHLLAATPVPVGDINQTPDFVGADNVTPVGAISYFAGRPTEADGPELFKTDGTTAGTVLVRNINPAAGSSPNLLTNVNGTLYFVADDGEHGRELWKSDGTAAGTTWVANLNAGTASSTPTNLTNVNGTLYFVANDGSGTTLYRTDGTAAGTTKVRLADGVSTLYTPTDLVAYNGRLLLTAGNGNSAQIYSVTAATATLVSTTPTYARHLTLFNGDIYFRISTDNSFGDKRRGDLWKTDGTAAGTTSVAAIDYLYTGANTDYASVGSLTASGDRLYFISGNAATGAYALWSSDGTTAGTRSVFSGSGLSIYNTPTPFGTRSVVFDVTTTSTSAFWITDGTLAGTRQLKSFPSTQASGLSGRVRLGDGRLLFTYQASYGLAGQVYTSDGTTAGTVVSAFISSSPAYVYPVGTVNGKALISATRSLTDGYLFVSDGTSSSTKRIGATVAANGSSLADLQSNYITKQFFAVGNTVYFSATDGNSGFELYKSVNRGTPVRVADLNPGAADSGISDYAAASDGSIYFITTHLGDRTVQLMRMAPDGTITQLVNGTSSAVNLTPIGTQLYFTVGNKLWRWAPGETAAAVTISDQFLGSSTRPVRTGDAWYFGATPTNANGSYSAVQRLYRIDNTSTARPTAVVDIPSGNSQTYVPTPIGAAGNTLLFTAYTAAAGTELWKTDGTAAGTSLLADLRPGTASSSFQTYNADYAFSADGVLYFGAGDGLNYSDVYRTDGTAEGTTKLTGGAVDARQFIGVGGRVYFVANVDNSTGTNTQNAVYRVDGTVATRLTTSLAGDAAFNPATLLAAGNNIFVVGAGGDRARFELWRADTQFNDFARVTVLAPRVPTGASGTLVGFYTFGRSALAATDTDLYFPMYADATGIEPYRLPLATVGSVSGVVYDDLNADGIRNTGENPIAGDVLYVDLNGNTTYDAGEPTATATAAGFTITGVPEGAYTVRRVPTTNGRRQTAPYLTNSGPTGVAVTVIADQTKTGVDFLTSNAPPTVSAGSYAVDEGRDVALHGNASQSFGTIVKYEWDFDYNNATFDADAVGQDITFSAALLDGNATRTIALRATDANGVSSVQPGTITINNVRPTATFASDGPVNNGDAATVRFTAPVDVAADLPGLRYSFDFNNNGTFTDAGDISLSTNAAASRVFGMAGTYTVRGQVTDKDGGYTDYTTAVLVSAADSTSVTLEGEAATFTGGTATAAGNTGYTGTGYADFAGINSSAQWSLLRVSAGATTLGFRYANGGTVDRPLTIYVNGTSIGTLAMPATGSWTAWQTVTIAANLTAGTNTIKAVASTNVGGANVDSLTVTRTAPTWLSAGTGAAYTIAGNTLTVTAGVVTLLADVATTHSGLAVVVSGSAKVITSAAQHLGSLTLNGTASFTMAGSRGQLLRMTALSLAPSATLDLNQGDLILDYAAMAPSPMTTIRGLISSARGGGEWAGVGLTSTAAKADTARRTTLGYLSATEYKTAYGANATFAGESLDDSALIVRYTLQGDTDLDRGVSINDFNRLSGRFGTTGRTWADGDSDFDNGVSINDFNLLTANFGSTLPAASVGSPVPRNIAAKNR